MGIVLAFIAIKSKSIFPSMIAHIFNNSINFIVAGVASTELPALQASFSVIYLSVGIMALILFIIKYWSEFLKIINEDTTILKTYEKVRASFSGKWSIAYIIFYIVFIIGTTVATNVMKVIK